MDQELLKKLTAMTESANDSDATLALRGLQGLFADSGLSLSQAILYAASHADTIKKAAMTVDHLVTPPPAMTSRAPVSISGTPQCHAPRDGHIELIPPGKSEGEVVTLPGESAQHAQMIALSMKDALVASAINKSRFKLKLLDIKNARGDVVETVLQAEYDREGMIPVRIWSNARGEVATLATVLRKAVASSFPDLVAA